MQVPVTASGPAPSAKTILIAHRQTSVRDRFAVALADARHRFVMADTEAAVLHALVETSPPIDLALLDLGLADDGPVFVRAIRDSSGPALPIVVFSGTVRAAADVPTLSSLDVSYINEHASTPLILPSLAPFLFPDTFNRRESMRIQLGVPISYRSGQTIAGAVTLDVGKGGLAIRSMHPLPKGSVVQVKFRLPGTAAEIDAAGRVAWSDGKVGMGVQFDKVSAVHQRALDEFIDQHR